MAFLSLPPTTNELTHSQRLRLMRSTRKLSEVLGTTPVFALPEPDRRQPSNQLHHPSPSMSASSSVRKAKALPRPLVLSLKSVPASLSPPRSSSGHYAPLSPTRSTNLPSSPTTPYHHDVDHDDNLLRIRRKRMAKLARTLGENIPAELVVDVPRRPSRPRSCSVDATNFTATFQVQLTAPTELAHSKDLLSPPPTQQKISRLLPKPPRSPTRSASLASRKPSLSTRKSFKRLHDTHSSTLGMDGLHLEEIEVGRKSSDTVRSTASSASNEYRKQAGWSGEWNRDMYEVMSQLRGLKAS
ncbi:hypothetical protein GYMLUDRAFT_36053 [Collybiopsis luxurians FD-317 M1]|nr:hypothetical protein GYMLUDRAFT_36053 [Collybiopsis luxurians FD-317 M1]